MTLDALRLPAFAAVCLAQLALPAWGIWQHQRVLDQGTAWQFKVQPVDPYDAFRGRFVYVAVEGTTIDRADVPLELEPGETVWATLATRDDGYAHVTGVSRTQPDAPAVQLTVGGVYDLQVALELPFDRIYMEETLAPRAEAAMSRWRRDDDDLPEASVRVKVLDGVAVADALLFDGQPARDWLEAHAD